MKMMKTDFLSRLLKGGLAMVCALGMSAGAFADVIVSKSVPTAKVLIRVNPSKFTFDKVDLALKNAELASLNERVRMIQYVTKHYCVDGYMMVDPGNFSRLTLLPAKEIEINFNQTTPGNGN